VRDELGRFTLIPDAPVEVTVKNDPFEKPMGAMLTPKQNDTLKGTIDVIGYAYTATGRITAVTLLVDGRSFAAVPFNRPATDVCATLPDVKACPNIGFSYSLDTLRIPNGQHLIGVVIVNDNGGSIYVPSINSYGANVNIQN